MDGTDADVGSEQPDSIDEGESFMSPVRKAILATAMVGSTLVGGGIGAALFAGSSASAQTTPTTTPAAAAPGVTAGGTFHSNEDATHEAGESAAREAQEDAGQVPTVP
jgi:hypothetical protein